MRKSLIFSGFHVAACVVLFLLFGLGLEGNTTGTWILPILLQPTLTLFGGIRTGGIFGLLLFLANSMVWGFVISWLICLIPRR